MLPWHKHASCSQSPSETSDFPLNCSKSPVALSNPNFQGDSYNEAGTPRRCFRITIFLRTFLAGLAADPRFELWSGNDVLYELTTCVHAAMRKIWHQKKKHVKLKGRERKETRHRKVSPGDRKTVSTGTFASFASHGATLKPWRHGPTFFGMFQHGRQGVSQQQAHSLFSQGEGHTQFTSPVLGCSTFCFIWLCSVLSSCLRESRHT